MHIHFVVPQLVPEGELQRLEAGDRKFTAIWSAQTNKEQFK